MLTTVGAPELVTDDLTAYEAKALERATDPVTLARIRQTLAANRLISPLFDGKRFARDIEAAYTAIYKRYQAGLSPDTIRAG